MSQKTRTLGMGHWMVLLAAFLGWMFDGLEMGLFPLVARPALQDLLGVGDESAIGLWNGRIAACFLLGAASGGLVFGWLGDRIGRVRSMMVSVLMYSGFTGLCYFAATPWQLGALRFLAALGMGGEWALGVALVMEYWPEKLRPLMAGIIGAAANVGFLAISVLAMLVEVTADSWRWMMIAGAAPALLALFIRLFVPESERWKRSVSEVQARPIRELFRSKSLKSMVLAIAFASIALIGTWGAVSGFLPLWADQLAGGDRVLTLTAEVLPDLPSDLTGALKNVEARAEPAAAEAREDRGEITTELGVEAKVWRAGARIVYRVRVVNPATDGVAGARLRAEIPRDLVDLASLQASPRDGVQVDRETGDLAWTVGAIEGRNPHAKGTVQFMLSIGAILGCLLGPLLGGRIGRRPAYFLLCLSSLIVCSVLFRVLDAYNALFLGMSVLAGLTTASFYGWLPLYLPELFATRVRATGQGLSFNFGRIAAAFAAMGTGTLMVYTGGSYPEACAVVTLVYLLGLVIIWFAPETKGRGLPD